MYAVLLLKDDSATVYKHLAADSRVLSVSSRKRVTSNTVWRRWTATFFDLADVRPSNDDTPAVVSCRSDSVQPAVDEPCTTVAWHLPIPVQHRIHSVRVIVPVIYL